MVAGVVCVVCLWVGGICVLFLFVKGVGKCGGMCGGLGCVGEAGEIAACKLDTGAVARATTILPPDLPSFNLCSLDSPHLIYPFDLAIQTCPFAQSGRATSSSSSCVGRALLER